MHTLACWVTMSDLGGGEGGAASRFRFWDLDLPPACLQPVPIRSEADAGDHEKNVS